MTGRPPRRPTLWKRPAPWTAQNAAHRALGNAQNAFPTRSHKGIIMSGENDGRIRPRTRERRDVVG
jgi:hypothetical protein